ncbi:outer membrane receptor for ferrienterochelin and colicins [Marivirga sericea]|uniref:Outer membrane receptor for ferrienterochelin and colicins n=1 Tax=Marivirga sericea TaxID=1028 RepID=A0A1X7LGW7_9BACT|nr:TonB-dependent receptor [Marivirga sericea]SMG53025.1 outer membrane receptor for ferrienterochelin and colicins [Marivirga sericea]
MKVTISTLIAFMFAAKLFAQVSIEITDQKGKQLEEVLVKIVSTNSSQEDLKWTDKNGQTLSQLNPPLAIQVSHLDYETIIDTLKTSGNHHYKLTAKNLNLREVVVTGQYEPESAKNAVYKVRSIGKERFERQAANDIQTVLSQELNIRFSRDNATGNANFQMQGLSGQYVKVLVDGIPISGKSGTNNAIDLNQIDVNNIERIELVEGPMAVNYGADALAGVINIITKKINQDRIALGITLHEESVGNDYSWFAEGIHSPSVQLSGKLSDQISAMASSRRYVFGGWVGQGNERNREWHPKNQWLHNAKLNYTNENFDLTYSTQLMQEEILNRGNINNNNPLLDPFAIDESYNANRLMHQLQANFDIGNWNIHSANSFTDYSRVSTEFQTNLVTRTERLTADSQQDTIFYRDWFSRNTFQGTIASLGQWKINGQLGLEVQYEQAGGTTLSSGDKDLWNSAAFISTEIKYGNALKIRPGIRYTVNSIFETIPTPALNIKYSLSEKIKLRLGYGRGFRAPSIRELYHEFIDANHNISGNENLIPETSHNFNADLNFEISQGQELNISAFYNDISNMITYFIPQQATAATTYRNLESFRTNGINARWNYSYKNFNSNLGLAYIGRFQRLSAEYEVNEMLYSPEANANINYDWEKPRINFGLFYKFTGANQAYREILNEENNTIVELQQMNAFHWLDFTLSKAFDHGFQLSTGIKNLTNITSIQNNFTGGGAHSGNNNGQTAMAYGRSYFLRINYQFNQ